VDLDHFLEKCRQGQWRVEDLDLTGPPPEMSSDEEIRVVQYLTDMVVIERLAGALFVLQRTKVSDPRLKEILGTFVADEVRHARVAELLAARYDVHRHRRYEVSPALAAFAPYFTRAIGCMTEDIAASYILVGELILDIALLRSLSDYIDDEVSDRAMVRINQDESRHLAIDHHLAEYYCSEAYAAELARRPRTTSRERIRAWWTFANLLRSFRAVFRDVFFEPMQAMDPGVPRLFEAFARIQLLGEKAEVRRRPFSRFMLAMMDLYNRPAARKVLGPLLERLTGIEGSLLLRRYPSHEAERAVSMSFEEHAAETEARAHRPSSRMASSIRRRMRSRTMTACDATSSSVGVSPAIAGASIGSEK
jgi:hypothetical protein